MVDVNLSGLPLGHAGEFPLEAEQQLTHTFTFQRAIGDGVGSELLTALASANMTGSVISTVVGIVTGTPNLAVQGGLILEAIIPAGFFGAYQNPDLALGQANFDGSLVYNDQTNNFEEWHPFSIYAGTLITGTLIVNATIGGTGAPGELFPAAVLEGGLSFEQFIGDGDVPGNELLSAAATANMTGSPDPLKDGGSPPFVHFNGTDEYLTHPVTADGELRGGANFSCVVVFDPEAVEQGQSGVLCGKHDPGSTEWGWRVAWDDTTGFISVTVSSSATGADRADRSTDTTDIRVRTVFVFTWDSTALEMYVAGASEQGVQTDTGTVGAMVQGDAEFAMGADNIGSTAVNFFQGVIHAVYIFDDVLTSGEVATIDQSGYLPSPLDDANLVVAWRPDRIEGSVFGFELTKWLDEIGNRQLDRPAANPLVCFPGIIDHLRFFSDEWNMDFINAEIVGVSLDQNLSSDFVLSVSTTNFVESGGFRDFVPVTGTAEPEIVTGFRTNRNDITVIWGGRKDEGSAANVVYFEMLGFQITFIAATREFWVFQGVTGTTTRYEFGQDLPGLEGPLPDGPATVFAFRYNSQLDQFTLFLNSVKLFEQGTTVTGTAITNTGLRFCENGSWGTLNGAAGQADRRAAIVLPVCLPDILMQQVLSGLSFPVYGMDNASPIGRTLRAVARQAPAPDLQFPSFVFYGLIEAADDAPPSPFPALLRPYEAGSGTVEILGQPLDGEQFRISDGTTTITFEIEIAGGITGDVAVNLGGTVTLTLVNIQTAINASALNLTASAPVVFAPDGLNQIGYVRITQDDLHDGDLPLSTLPNAASIVGGRVRVTGPYVVRGPVGSVSLADGVPSDGDQVSISDGTTTVVFEFESGGGVGPGNTAVTIGTIETTIDSLVTAINASALTITADATVTQTRFEPTIDAAYTVLTHQSSSDPEDYTNRVDRLITIPVNVSGNLAETGIEQPAPFAEAIPQFVGVVYGLDNNTNEYPYVDNPYAVLEAEADDPGGGGLPPFINPNPTISSVTADIAHNVTAVANAGPTDAGDVRSWWEIELVDGDPQFNLRIDEQDNNFSINKAQIDTFPVPLGQNWEDLRIRFVIQSQLDPDQSWFSLYVRMDSENFNNAEVEIIILPGAGAPETPPAIELELSLEEQAFVVNEADAGAQRQLQLSNRSRYKLTRIFFNEASDPRIEGRNEDGLEFGLLSVLDDFLKLGTNVRTHTVTSADIGFLDQIAVKFYGAGFEDFWWVLGYVNNIADPDEEMFVGQTLTIPPREAVTTFLARKPAAVGS